jgi:hypothetical protein
MSLGFARMALLSIALTVAPNRGSAAPDLIWPVCDIQHLSRLPEKGLSSMEQDGVRDLWWEDPATKIYLEFGTPVFAAGDGNVLSAARSGPFGNAIDVVHADGFFTRYGHLLTMLVRAGDRVERGQKIGSVGASGRSARPGLYLAVHNNQMLFAPETVMRKPPCKGDAVVLPPPTLRGTQF